MCRTSTYGQTGEMVLMEVTEQLVMPHALLFLPTPMAAAYYPASVPVSGCTAKE